MRVADVNLLPRVEISPIGHACFHNCVEIVQMLINAGADVNYYGQFYQSPLDMAIIDNNDELVNLLILAGADVIREDVNGFTPLMVARFHAGALIQRILIGAGGIEYKRRRPDTREP